MFNLNELKFDDGDEQMICCLATVLQY
uniref:Uncharacterized protein n=1 Tax=Arundo donax TaxID=35708 RepID=A0A0A9AIC1_ARUDO